MTTKNAARCRAYHERVKQDPVKHQARIARISENRRSRQAASLAGHVKQHVKQGESFRALSELLDEPTEHVKRAPCEAPPERVKHTKQEPCEAPPATKRVKQPERVKHPVGEPEAREAPLDLDYEERAAIMEFDGGLTRAEAEFEAALRSTVPLVPAAPLKEPAAPQGGKHAASQAQGEIDLTAEQILDVWRQHWAT